MEAKEAVHNQIKHREWRLRGGALGPLCHRVVASDVFVPGDQAAEVAMHDVRKHVVFQHRTGQLEIIERLGDCALAVERLFMREMILWHWLPIQEQTEVRRPGQVELQLGDTDQGYTAVIERTTLLSLFDGSSGVAH
jgi:hypothetical protein